MQTDARVDAYIAKSAPFAQPLLTKLREQIRKACPQAVETIKWNVPFYMLDGQCLASLAAFKKHVKVGVWTGKKPDFTDITQPSELPAASAFTQKVKAAAQVSAAAPTSKSSRKATAKKTGKAATKKAPKRASKKTARAAQKR